MEQYDIIKLYRDHWFASDADFCKLYDISTTSFASWLEGGSFPNFRYAVIDFVENGAPLYAIRRTINESQLMWDILRRADQLHHIAFADGDNVVDLLADGNFLSTAPTDESFRLIITVRQSMQPSLKLLSLLRQDWVTVVRAESDSKGAVDLSIVIQMSSLNVMLEKHTVFFVITRDYFGKQICSSVRKFGRECEWISNGSLNLKVNPTDRSNDNQQSLPMYEQKRPLQELFKLAWPDSQGEFCRRYNIDKNNFSRWLNYKKTSPISEKYVREFLGRK
jgi:hypothetical protein